jgi:membrane protease YdiL (CAAX protease family)
MTEPRTQGSTQDSRVRAYLEFVAALFYFIGARVLARHAAQGLASPSWEPLVEQAMLAFLLLAGYAAMGFSLARQTHPVSTQGLPFRSGWTGEVGLGLATGWGVAAVCVAAMAAFGGILIRFHPEPGAWGWLATDIAYFLLLALVEEVAFRGYGFQRLSRALGSSVAVIGYALLYALLVRLQPGANTASVFVAIALSLALSTAYLRTKALWVSWGLNFGWKASRALLFGLTISGNSSHSNVVEGDPMGGFWLTGSGFGLDGSWFAFLVLLAAIPLVYRLTRDLDFHYNAPAIIPGGIPVDLDAAARKQHEAAMGQTEPAPPALVQIAPLAAPASPSPAPAPAPEQSTGTGNDLP